MSKALQPILWSVLLQELRTNPVSPPIPTALKTALRLRFGFLFSGIKEM